MMRAVKLKKKRSGEVREVESSGAVASAGRLKKHTRPDVDVASKDSQHKKRAKTALATGSKEAPAAASPAVPESIQIGGGAVDCVGLDKALRALSRHVQKLQQQTETPDLLAGSGGPTVCLMFSLQNIPDRQRVIPHLIELPHSPLETGSEVCLIVKDPQRKWKDLVASIPSLSAVTKVISYRKLPKKFPQFADKRTLCAAYDLFLVDTKVKEKAYNSLGTTFFAANKLPFPVRVGTTTLEREVGKALRSTSLVLKRGPSVAIRIGKALSPPEHLFANAVAAIKGVSSFFQQNHRWKNTVATIHVQATNTPALPIYFHPKYAQSAEHYRQTKPHAADTEKEKKEKKQKAIQESLKTPNKAGKVRKMKRGGSEKDKKHGGKKSLKKSFKDGKAKKPKKQQ
ncbi:hypothetical protein Efla_000200 [Eimeria flavescens]